MRCLDEGLRTLVEAGLKHGQLTFSQVNSYLPDEAPDPVHLDNLIICLEELNIQLVPDPEVAQAAVPPTVRRSTTALAMACLSPLWTRPHCSSRSIRPA